MKTVLRLLAFVSLALAGACSRSVDVQNVPVGTEVELTKQDGVVVRGKIADRDKQTVKIDVGTTQRSVSFDQIADLRVVGPDSKTSAELPAIAKFREYTVPAGTTLAVRLDSPLSSVASRVEDAVEATLVDPVTIRQVDVLPTGSRLTGQVVSVEPSGKVKGRASLALRFNTVVLPDGGSYPVTARLSEIAPATKASDAEKIALPAAGGAIVGGLIGGKKGAAIGAVVGGGAGAAEVLTTPGREVSLPRGTPLSLSLEASVDVKSKWRFIGTVNDWRGEAPHPTRRTSLRFDRADASA